MGVARLPLVAELRDRLLLPLRDEDRVEAEAFGAARLFDYSSRKHARAADLLAGGGERDELADIARAPAFPLDALELSQ